MFDYPREVEGQKMSLCIGLFGTCGGSVWRDPFMKKYEELGLTYYNPQVAEGEWEEAFADIEADHLADDRIVLFPVTGETYASGSLTETGFSALQAVKLGPDRDFVVMIERELDPSLDDPIARKESIRCRALASKHLQKLGMSNIYFVETLDDMLELSIGLYQVAQARLRLERFRAIPK